MTNEQIKQGLECCAKLPCSDCENCPYEEIECKQGLLEDSLDCINNLEDRILGIKKAYTIQARQLKELLSALYQRTGEQGFTLYRKDIVELAKDYGIKEEELNVFWFVWYLFPQLD